MPQNDADSPDDSAEEYLSSSLAQVVDDFVQIIESLRLTHPRISKHLHEEINRGFRDLKEFALAYRLATFSEDNGGTLHFVSPFPAQHAGRRFGPNAGRRRQATLPAG